LGNDYPKAGVMGGNNSSSGDYFDALREMTAFESQAVFRQREQTIELNGLPQRIHAMAVTPSWFTLLRVSPLIGRPFTEVEGEPGHEHEVILSYSLWQQLFAGDQSVLGRDLRISSQPYNIVGVMPKNFDFIDPDVRLWMPIAFTAEEKTV